MARSAAVVSPAVTVTYYVEILSSWCHWAEPAWDELKQRYAGRDVAFTWRIALMQPADFPATRAHCDWFYQRSGGLVRSPYMLHSGWIDPALHGDYAAPNLVAEAARPSPSSSADPDLVRRALAHAALREGQRIGDLDTAVAVAARAPCLDPAKLRRAARSAAVRDRVAASTADFHARGLTQRPAFVLASRIGDLAVFSGVWRAAPLITAIDTLLDDVAGYASHAAHHAPYLAR
jgi:predicted DsbA family dithiol-disulfide isomerase